MAIINSRGLHKCKENTPLCRIAPHRNGREPGRGRDRVASVSKREGSLSTRLAKIPGEGEKVVEIHVAVPVEITDQPG